MKATAAACDLAKKNRPFGRSKCFDHDQKLWLKLMVIALSLLSLDTWPE